MKFTCPKCGFGYRRRSPNSRCPKCAYAMGQGDVQFQAIWYAVGLAVGLVVWGLFKLATTTM